MEELRVRKLTASLHSRRVNATISENPGNRLMVPQYGQPRAGKVECQPHLDERLLKLSSPDGTNYCFTFVAGNFGLVTMNDPVLQPEQSGAPKSE